MRLTHHPHLGRYINGSLSGAPVVMHADLAVIVLDYYFVESLLHRAESSARSTACYSEWFEGITPVGVQ